MSRKKYAAVDALLYKKVTSFQEGCSAAKLMEYVKMISHVCQMPDERGWSDTETESENENENDGMDQGEGVDE
jgi:hypothetical protein